MLQFTHENMQITQSTFTTKWEEIEKDISNFNPDYGIKKSLHWKHEIDENNSFEVCMNFEETKKYEGSLACSYINKTDQGYTYHELIFTNPFSELSWFNDIVKPHVEMFEDDLAEVDGKDIGMEMFTNKTMQESCKTIFSKEMLETITQNITRHGKNNKLRGKIRVLIQKSRNPKFT